MLSDKVKTLWSNSLNLFEFFAHTQIQKSVLK